MSFRGHFGSVHDPDPMIALRERKRASRLESGLSEHSADDD